MLSGMCIGTFFFIIYIMQHKHDMIFYCIWQVTIKTIHIIFPETFMKYAIQ